MMSVTGVVKAFGVLVILDYLLSYVKSKVMNINTIRFIDNKDLYNEEN